MKKLTARLKKQLVKLKRHEHQPIIPKIRQTHKLSRQTIFYMKEYGPKSHIPYVILKESLPALVLALLFGTIGGIGLQTIKSNFILFLPLLILLPALNDMIGDYSMIMTSRLSTLAFTKGIGNWRVSKDIKRIIQTILVVAVLSSVYIGLVSSVLAYLKGYPLTFGSVAKVVQVSLFTTSVMVGIVITISIFAVLYVYKRKEDPNNLVMPIMASIADLGTIVTVAIILSLML